jgi:hypothetical protein
MHMALSVVIDVNPAKQGRYLPATGLLVQSPAEALPTLSAAAMIFVMNSSYRGIIYYPDLTSVPLQLFKSKLYL